ncbi:copper chaperone PCu(A)C [Alishewanella longhuensis]
MRYFLILYCIVLCFTPAIAQTDLLQLKQGEVRVPMPGRTVTAGYFTLYNGSAAAIELVGASSSAFQHIELHQHIEHEGMMRMVEVAAIEIDAGATLVFQPGGLHLMLFEPLQPLTEGDEINITLDFADGKQLAITLPLTAMPRR